jgi:hypothetical protein
MPKSKTARRNGLLVSQLVKTISPRDLIVNPDELLIGHRGRAVLLFDAHPPMGPSYVNSLRCDPCLSPAAHSGWTIDPPNNLPPDHGPSRHGPSLKRHRGARLVECGSGLANVALQPRRSTIPKSAVGCKRCIPSRLPSDPALAACLTSHQIVYTVFFSADRVRPGQGREEPGEPRWDQPRRVSRDGLNRGDRVRQSPSR